MIIAFSISGTSRVQLSKSWFEVSRRAGKTFVFPVPIRGLIEIGRNPVSKHHIPPGFGEWAGRRGTGRPNPSRETKFSYVNGDRDIFIFPVQLTTSRIGNLTRLNHNLLSVMTIHTYIHTHNVGSRDRLGYIPSRVGQTERGAYSRAPLLLSTFRDGVLSKTVTQHRAVREFIAYIYIYIIYIYMERIMYKVQISLQKARQ